MNDMTTPILIRIATREDLTAVLELYREAGLDRDGGMSPQEAGAVFLRFAAYPSYKLYVACLGDRVVGTFALLIMDNLAHHGTPSGIVSRNASSCGVGLPCALASAWKPFSSGARFSVTTLLVAALSLRRQLRVRLATISNS